MPIRKSNKSALQMQKEFGQFKKRLPRFVGTIAVGFFKENFRKQGFIDESLKRWKPRSTKQKRKGKRSLLVQSGRLRKSIRIARIGTNYVQVGTDVPYAQIHNEGGKLTMVVTVRQHKRKTRSGSTTVRSHKRKMNTTIPQRKFIGKSAGLNKRIERQMIRRLTKILLK